MAAEKYSWSRSFGVEAQIVGEFFGSLTERTPESFVANSKNKKTPTHILFEWDDSAAAHNYRLVQARIIISSLQVEIVDSEQKEQRVHAFIGASQRGAYVATLQATVEEMSAAEELCVGQMRRFKARWKGLTLARDVLSAISATEQKVSRRKRKAA